MDTQMTPNAEPEKQAISVPEDEATRLIAQRIEKLKEDREALRVRLQDDLNAKVRALRESMLDQLLPHDAAIGELSVILAKLKGTIEPNGTPFPLPPSMELPKGINSETIRG